MLTMEVVRMPRFYIEIPDPPYEEAMRRALAQRRSTREQIAYDIERLYIPAHPEAAEQKRYDGEARP